MEIRTQKGRCREKVWRIWCQRDLRWTDQSREMQLFLVAFIVVEICEIFTVGGFPLHDSVRKVGRINFACCHVVIVR